MVKTNPFHGIAGNTPIIFDLPEVVEMLSERYDRNITPIESEAIATCLGISYEMVNLAAEAIKEWRESKNIEDLAAAVYEVDLGDGKVVELKMENIIAIIGGPIADETSEYETDIANVRHLHKTLLNDNSIRRAMYYMVDSHKIKNN